MLGDDRAFETLKRRILLDRGLDCRQYKEAYLKRRIGVRLRATGAGDYLEYVRVLRRDPDEYTKLLDELTINVTQFFRDRDVFDRLAGSVIPGIVESKNCAGRRSLRAWSAGCASGEEPYSLAILLLEELGERAASWNVRVVGSDIDEGSLRAARAALYREVELPEGVDRDRYFAAENDGTGECRRVTEDVRRLVKFEKENILEPGGRRNFDLVLCRNVLIYFARGVQGRVVRNIAGSMRPDGFLVLGKSETLGQDTSGMFKPVYPRERIYRLGAAGAAARRG